MSTYTQKKCPHCGTVYRSYQGKSQRLYGCPLISCPKCKQPFWDSDIKEPALYGIEKERSILSHFWVYWFTLTSIAMLVFGIINLAKDELLYGILFTILGVFGCLVFGAILITGIRDALHPEKQQLLQQQQYDASKERLQNTNYLAALTEYDPLAKNLFAERMAGMTETYAARPEITLRVKKASTKKEVKPIPNTPKKNNNHNTRVQGNSLEVKSQEELLTTIEKLKKMYDDNILTQEEFEEKKAELLKRL